jgi:hypothetical protein
MQASLMVADLFWFNDGVREKHGVLLGQPEADLGVNLKAGSMTAAKF